MDSKEYGILLFKLTTDEREKALTELSLTDLELTEQQLRGIFEAVLGNGEFLERIDIATYEIPGDLRAEFDVFLAEKPKLVFDSSEPEDQVVAKSVSAPRPVDSDLDVILNAIATNDLGCVNLTAGNVTYSSDAIDQVIRALAEHQPSNVKLLDFTGYDLSEGQFSVLERFAQKNVNFVSYKGPENISIEAEVERNSEVIIDFTNLLRIIETSKEFRDRNSPSIAHALKLDRYNDLFRPEHISQIIEAIDKHQPIDIVEVSFKGFELSAGQKWVLEKFANNNPNLISYEGPSSVGLAEAVERNLETAVSYFENPVNLNPGAGERFKRHAAAYEFLEVRGSGSQHDCPSPPMMKEELVKKLRKGVSDLKQQPRAASGIDDYDEAMFEEEIEDVVATEELANKWREAYAANSSRGARPPIQRDAGIRLLGSDPSKTSEGESVEAGLTIPSRSGRTWEEALRGVADTRDSEEAHPNTPKPYLTF